MEELPPASYFHGKTLLGLDYGTVVLGTALFRVGEDPFPLLADPIDRKNDRQALEAILSLAALEGIHHIVLGLPLHLDGTPSPMSRRVGRFGQKIREAAQAPLLGIFYQDEALTSHEARSLMNRSPKFNFKASPRDTHGVAASMVLEEFLARAGRAVP